jgi:hemerythrin superfamily protein
MMKHTQREAASHLAPRFFGQVVGAVDKTFRVLRAAAGALVEDDTETDVLAMLTAHHRYVERLFARLEKLDDGRLDEAQALVDELVEALVAHAAVEEAHFYPAVRTRMTNALVLESIEEHLALKRTLLDLALVAPEDDSFMAKLATLKQQVIHHAREEEERKLFPLVRTLLSREEREAMAQELTGAMVEVLEGPSPVERLRLEVAAGTGAAARTAAL